jgi:hypothetical protein
MHVLALADQVEQGPLVLGDGGLVDLPDLVEGAMGEVDPIVPDHQPAIGIVVDGIVRTKFYTFLLNGPGLRRS